MRLEGLLRGLMLIGWRDTQPCTAQADASLPPGLPRAYALLKLLFLPGGKLRRGRQAEPTEIKHEPSVVPLLRAGRVGDALDTALRRLRSSGLMPYTHQFHFPKEDVARLAAALLIPVSERSTGLLAEAVLRPVASDA